MKLTSRYLLTALTVFAFGVGNMQAQTVISGPSIMTSTWSPAGSPYIVTADCTVPAGQTLTIQPGTVVWMGSGTSLTGNGIIQAVGTAAQRITFQPPVASQMWNTIAINNTIGTNEFKYCDFSGATNALYFGQGLGPGGGGFNEVSGNTFSDSIAGLVLRVNSTNRVTFCEFKNVGWGIYMTVGGDNSAVFATRTQQTSIENCNFTNSASEAIYGQSIGSAVKICGIGCTGYAQDTVLIATVKNCAFRNSNAGCFFYCAGAFASGSGITPRTGYGRGNLRLANNSFENVTNTGIRLAVGAYPGGGPANVMNNTLVNVGNGVVVQDPWDSMVQNNVFQTCGIGMTRSGSLSATVSYNDLFGNTANFSGYPVTYGQVILANRNGTPCDVLFNIFSDPMFVSSSDFHLQAGSPCIDAGEGGGANFDSYFPPSMGSVTNDIGAYGGPNAGQWIVAPPTNAFTLGITEIPHVSVTVNPPSPGHYRLEYSSDLVGTNNWIQITNLDLTTLPFTYTEPATTPARYYRAVKQ